VLPLRGLMYRLYASHNGSGFVCIIRCKTIKEVAIEIGKLKPVEFKGYVKWIFKNSKGWTLAEGRSLEYLIEAFTIATEGR
jgi:hypothetical protein